MNSWNIRSKNQLRYQLQHHLNFPPSALPALLLQESSSRSSHRSTVLTPQSDSTPAATTPTPTKVPSSLSLPAAGCTTHNVPVPAPLEDLSPDSIDAQTFDFETIGHPNMDPVLQQGSLDMDSLAESPESDFMSAVNEFVIEENLTSPNAASDPTSPEKMVESLYSSVINAIDNKRMLDTTTLERENTRIAALQQVTDKYRTAAEESRCSLVSVKEDLRHLRGKVLKEKQDFAFVLRSASAEVCATVDSFYHHQKLELQAQHQSELLSVRQALEKKVETLEEENQVNQNIVRDIQRAMLELEGLLERKEKELTQLESERERWAEADADQKGAIRKLEEVVGDRAKEMETLQASNDLLSARLQELGLELERTQREIREELRAAERSHLEELQERLKQEHAAELQTIAKENQEALDHLATESDAVRNEANRLHAAAVREKDERIKDLEARCTELGELRCKLEVELALKESEAEELRREFQEAEAQQAEAFKSQAEAETRALREELVVIRKELQAKNEEYEVDLAELRSLMRIEKDHCISELVERHDEETAALRTELSALLLQAEDAKRSHSEQQQKLQQEVDEKVGALRREQEEQTRGFQELEQQFRSVIGNLQAENDQLSKRLEVDRRATLKEPEKEEALKELSQQKDEMEKRLSDRIRQLESELQEQQSSNR